MIDLVSLLDVRHENRKSYIKKEQVTFDRTLLCLQLQDIVMQNNIGYLFTQMSEKSFGI